MATLRKVDKPRTAMSMLKKEEKSIKNRTVWNGQYSNTRAYNQQKDLKKNWDKQAKVQKVIDSRTKANNKDLSKSLWSVASNKWMKKSDLQWTIKVAKDNLSKAKQQQRTYNSSLHKWSEISQQKAALNKQVKTAEKNVKSLEKTAKKRK